MSAQRIARRYAQALLESAIAENQLEVIEADIQTLAKAGASSSELRSLMRSPVVDNSKKSNVIKEVFGNAVSPLMMRFLLLMIHKNREMYYTDVIREMGVLCDEHRNIVRVDVTSAFELDAKERSAITSKLEAKLGKTVIASYLIDPAIVGGITVKIGDTITDSSIRRQLEMLRASLLN